MYTNIIDLESDLKDNIIQLEQCLLLYMLEPIQYIKNESFLQKYLSNFFRRNERFNQILFTIFNIFYSNTKGSLLVNQLMQLSLLQSVSWTFLPNYNIIMFDSCLSQQQRIVNETSLFLKGHTPINGIILHSL